MTYRSGHPWQDGHSGYGHRPQSSETYSTLSHHSLRDYNAPRGERGGYRGRGGPSRGSFHHREYGRYSERPPPGHCGIEKGKEHAFSRDYRYPEAGRARGRAGHASLADSPAETLASLPGQAGGASSLTVDHTVPSAGAGLATAHSQGAVQLAALLSPDLHSLDSLDKLVRYHARLTEARPSLDAEFGPQDLALVAQSFLKGKTGNAAGGAILADGLQANKISTPEPGEVIESPKVPGIDAAARARELKDELLKKKRKAQWEATIVKKESAHTSLPTGQNAFSRQDDVQSPRKRQRVHSVDGDPQIRASTTQRIERSPERQNARYQDESRRGRGGQDDGDSHQRPGRQEVNSEDVQRTSSIYEPSATNFVPERYRNQSGSMSVIERRSPSPPKLIVQPPSTSTVSLLGQRSQGRDSGGSLRPDARRTSTLSRERSRRSSLSHPRGSPPYVPPVGNYGFLGNASAYDAQGRFVGSSRRDTNTTWASVYQEDTFPRGPVRPGGSPLRVNYTGPSPVYSRRSTAPSGRASSAELASNDVLATLNALKAQIAKLEAQLPGRPETPAPPSRGDDHRRVTAFPRVSVPPPDHPPAHKANVKESRSGRRWEQTDERDFVAEHPRATARTGRRLQNEGSISPSRLTPLPRAFAEAGAPPRSRGDAPFHRRSFESDSLHEGSSDPHHRVGWSRQEQAAAQGSPQRRLHRDDHADRRRYGKPESRVGDGWKYSTRSASPERRASRYERYDDRASLENNLARAADRPPSVALGYRRSLDFPDSHDRPRLEQTGPGRGMGYGRGGYRGRGRGYIRGRGRGH